MFVGASDAFIIEQIQQNAPFLIDGVLPVSKGKSKNDDEITPEQWFAQLSFLHLMIFRNAFLEGKSRGILGPEILIPGQEIVDIIG